jgi:hypothetical protein
VSTAIARHEMLPNGMRLQPGLDFDEWLGLVVKVAGMQRATSWALGDLLFYGEWEWGQRYEEAVAATGLAYQTCADLKYVAGRFEFSRRRESLSLSHHREVAALPLDEQDAWLDRADAGKWTREQFRQELAAPAPVESGSSPIAQSPTEVLPRESLTQLVIVAREEQHVAWSFAAGDRDLTVEEWVRCVCDDAAA